MRVQQDLQVGLRERFRRCLTADFRTLGHETQLTRRWIAAQPQLVALLADAARVEPDLDLDHWVQAAGQGGLSWSSTTEEGRATLTWAMIKAVADDENQDRVEITYGQGISHSTNLNDRTREFVERIYAPLFDYLTEQVGTESSVIYALERFKRYVEWFVRNELFAAFQTDRQQGEAIYDSALRRFLFREGINMPFSQAQSASGLSDVLSELDTDDPLICEVKLFGDGHAKSGIGRGVHQALLYAQDYSKSTAYLVVINLTGQPIEFPNDGAEKSWPPYVDVGGVRVYVVSIRALPTESASKVGKAKPTKITRADLTNPDA